MNYISAIASLTSILLLTACGGGRTSNQVRAATNEVQGDSHDDVKVLPALASQIKVSPVQYGQVSRHLRAAGRVEANELHLARISSSVVGRVREIQVESGALVKRGQTLATVSSTELSSVELTFLESLSRRQLAEKAVDRAEQLLSADVIGSAELQRRQAELQEKREEVDAARSQLKILGISDSAAARLERGKSVDSVSQITASVSGTLLERKLTVGQVVQPSDIAFVVADLSTVWLVADVPEESAGMLRKGKVVHAEVLAFPGEIIEGKLAFVSPIVNPDTRTVRIRMDLPNAAHRFKPDMLANVSLQDTPLKQLAVPSSAIVREDNKEYVFVRTTPNHFKLREVKLGADLENSYVISEGLQAGENIVTGGAFHLNNERKRLALTGGAE